MAYDIIVNMTDNTQVTSKEGFGKTLVFCTTKDIEKQYDISDDLSLVQEDFPVETEMYKIINTFASQQPRPKNILVLGKDLSSSEDKGNDIITTLNDFITKTNDWYRLIVEDLDEKIISKVSEWAETNSKQFYTQLSNTEFTTDYSSKKRTVLNFKKNDDRLDAAMAGYASTRVPGSYTFKFKNLKNISADSLTPTEIKTTEEKNMNIYIRKFQVIGMGQDQLNNGIVANGDYIDHYESMDWIVFRVKQEVAKLLMTTEKVPYTDDGIQSVVLSVITALNDGVSNGIIATNAQNEPLYDVNFLTVDEIDLEDRKNRKLTGINFKYVEAGAIESVTVNGSVALQL